ncbi:hypothetical protein ACTNEF_09680 [Bariatricus sp. HCP28S3_E4]|uniref:hypothetical protein n=1 Tax=unclassified Bariatricus TaxID=2677046 RepID=UPI003F8CB09A
MKIKKKILTYSWELVYENKEKRYPDIAGNLVVEIKKKRYSSKNERNKKEMFLDEC